MSQFIEKLNEVSRGVPQPIGFRMARSAAEKPKILLVAGLARSNIDNMADYVAGADAGLLNIPELSSDAKTLQKVAQKISQIVPGIPWGGWLRDGSGEGIERLVEVDFDFVVFPAASTSLGILQNGKAGMVLQVEASLADGLLSAVNELPVDAVFVTSEYEEGRFLTWHHLMTFQHFANLITKPLLVSVPVNATANELVALWKAGVVGIVVRSGEAGKVKELHQLIEQTDFPQRKRERREALLPYIGRETGSTIEEDE